MVETITPVVYGGRGRWATAVGLHVLGATLAASVFGALLAAVGALLGAPWGRAGALAVVGLAVLYTVAELPNASVAVPQLRRQVPDWWRTFFGRSITAFLYGAGLGVGFFTYLAHGSLVVISAAALASGRPARGAVVVGVFGLARGLSAAVAAQVDSAERGRALVDRLASSSSHTRAVANGAALVVVALAGVALAWRLRDGWAELASAATAIAFAWSAVAKLAGRPRWLRALAAHRLPPPFDELAGWAVPMAEMVVPVLAVLGYLRASAAWAFVLLAVFSLALIRARRLVGRDIPCGCFGGRGTIDVRRALARNGALAAIAGLAFVASTDVASSLPFPTGADVLPAALTAAGLVAAVTAGWRSAVWLGRGRSG
jgi:hypothetical protein